MDPRRVQPVRLEPARARRRWRARFAAFGSLTAVAALLAVIVFGATSGSGSHTSNRSNEHEGGSSSEAASASQRTGTTGSTAVPILAYDIINAPPPQSAVSADLYVPAAEFSAQMEALKAAGWHAVTLDQLEAYWTRGSSLGSGKPIVITFDNGYASQYANAAPVLKQLGWVGVENLQVEGLSPSEGGLTDSQVRSLIDAGWELGTNGVSQPDLTTLDSTQLSDEITTARQTLRDRYGVPVNWFSYPSGRYDPTVTAAVRAAGFVGSTTIIAGWASPQSDRFRLPRLQVLSGTTPAALLAQIASSEQDTSAPAAYYGA